VELQFKVAVAVVTFEVYKPEGVLHAGPDARVVNVTDAE
jgi:hypothetical protein